MSRAEGFFAVLLLSACTRDAIVPVPGSQDGSVAECLMSAECPLGEVCLGGSCQAPIASPPREGCTKDDDCPDLRDACARTTGECVRVAGRCLSNEDCPGAECDLARRSCAPGPFAEPTCEEDRTRPCGASKVGECRFGAQTCSGAAWGECQGAIWPRRELCDGRDDDCDGAIDEAFDLHRDPLHCGSCGHVCAFPHAGALCRDGACALGPCEPGWYDLDGDPANGCEYSCTPDEGGAELCNGRDDDCDGATDEELGSTRCGEGACARVTQNCLAGALQTCVAGAPAAEQCNAADDDCDGSTDEDFDEDFDGFATCAQDCDDHDGAVHPGAPERCNGRDDDCDAVTDEGFDLDGDCFTTCGTSPGCGSAACAASYGACSPSIAVAQVDCNDFNPTIHPQGVELCGPAGTGNGLDDDCDGYLDEGCGPCADTDADGWSTCAGDCDDRDPAVHPGALERCNGRDDDCNTSTTENCGVGEPCHWPSGADVCRARLACARNLSTGQYVCGSFCNFSQAGAGLGDGCAAGESCQFKVVASANEHLCGVPATPPGSKLAGEACSADAECRSSACYCPRAGPAGCEVERYCTDYCGDDVGDCSGSTACTIVASTVGSAWVYTGRCLQPTGSVEPGGACSGDGSECRNGALSCVEGTCSRPCCNDASCGGGQHCSNAGAAVAYGAFLDSGKVAVATVPVCRVSAAGNLGRPGGAACQANADCRSEFCERSATGGTCIGLCCRDADCDHGSTCEVARVRRPDDTEHWARVCIRAPGPGTLVQEP